MIWAIYAFFLGAVVGGMFCIIVMSVYGDTELNESVREMRKLRYEMHVRKTALQFVRFGRWLDRVGFTRDRRSS